MVQSSVSDTRTRYSPWAIKRSTGFYWRRGSPAASRVPSRRCHPDNPDVWVRGSTSGAPFSLARLLPSSAGVTGASLDDLPPNERQLPQPESEPRKSQVQVQVYVPLSIDNSRAWRRGFCCFLEREEGSAASRNGRRRIQSSPTSHRCLDVDAASAAAVFCRVGGCSRDPPHVASRTSARHHVQPSPLTGRQAGSTELTTRPHCTGVLPAAPGPKQLMSLVTGTVGVPNVLISTSGQVRQQ